MNANDKTEKVLREIHIMLSKAEPYKPEPSRVIINKQQMIDLLAELNKCIYAMQDEYELTEQSRNHAEREFRKKGDQIVWDASRKAEDVYAASVIYTDEALSRVRDIINDTNESLEKLCKNMKDKIAEQKQKADEAYTSIKQQLSDNPNLNITFLGHTNNLRYAGSHTMSKDQILESYGQEVLDTLYNMQDGDISPVIETENGYHIFQMTYLTDEKATATNKAELTKEANDAYFNNLLTNWVSKIDKDYTYSKSVNTDVYSMITFS